MKAIPTIYDGVVFRSRLEARWAAFFSALALDWRYEHERFARWLPDFWLPELDLTVEVKPVRPDLSDKCVSDIDAFNIEQGYGTLLFSNDYDHPEGPHAVVIYGEPRHGKYGLVTSGCCGAGGGVSFYDDFSIGVCRRCPSPGSVWYCVDDTCICALDRCTQQPSRCMDRYPTPPDDAYSRAQLQWKSPLNAC